jgi:hypothetical protein
MKKTGVILLIGMLLLITLYPGVSADDSGVVIDQQQVTISLASKGLQVDEIIKVTNIQIDNATELRFWIQQDAQDTSIIELTSGTTLTPLISGNIRTCNLTAANLTIEKDKSLTIQLTYFLSSTNQYFVQNLLYDTAALTVVYKDGTTELNLFQGEHLLTSTDVNNALQVRLYKPTEAPLNITILVVVFAVVLLIIASLLFLLKKQRTKTKKAVVETEETLTTKKSLLLSLLKDLEKQYRAQTISNETYTKLKEEYKTQAVDTMKKLDDLKK